MTMTFSDFSCDEMYYFRSKETGDYFRFHYEVDDEPDDPREDDNIATMLCWSRYKLGDVHGYDGPIDAFRALVNQYCTRDEIVAYLKTGEGYTKIEPNLDADQGTGYPKYDWEVWYRDSLEDEWRMDHVMYIDNFIADELDENDLLNLLKPHVVMTNLYLLDHSGLSISTSSFNDPWDSGCVGFAYITKETIKKEFGRTMSNFENEWRSKAEKAIEAEVDYYDEYLQGNCYGYQLEKLVDDGTDWEENDSCWGFMGYKDDEEMLQEMLGPDFFDEYEPVEAPEKVTHYTFK